MESEGEKVRRDRKEKVKVSLVLRYTYYVEKHVYAL